MSSNGEHFDPIEEDTRRRIARGQFATQADLDEEYDEVRNHKFFTPEPIGWRKMWKKVCDVWWLVTYVPQVPPGPGTLDRRLGRHADRSRERKNSVLERLRWF